MKFRWISRQKSADCASGLHSVSLIEKCLRARGFCSPEAAADFLSPRLKNLQDPFLIGGIKEAVSRLIKARQQGEKVVVFGDYDVDGVTATAILVKGLGELGWNLRPYLPHRVDEGYGLSEAAVQRCLDDLSPQLIVAVDCGTASPDVVAELKKNNLGVIILDHHQPGKILPEADALVNPQLEENGFKELCAAGLAFKLLHAVVKQLRDDGDPKALEFDVREYLQFAALGTIADIVPVTGENRILASSGLAWLNKTKSPGLIALKEVAQIKTKVTSYHVGYLLAPRLNAAGRLEDAMLALQLLLTESIVEAAEIAAKLNETNQQRQQTELEILNQALELIQASFSPERDYIIIQGDSRWHIGVVGIVASRIQQKFHRPVILAGGGDNEWRGSGRSIQGFNIAANLQNCSELLIKHGGHAMAAGITINPQNLNAFREKMNGLARVEITVEQLQPVLAYDAEVLIAELTLAAVKELESFEPFGPGNPGINFLIRNTKLKCPPVRFGKENKHLRCVLSDGSGTCTAIWWNCPVLEDDQTIHRDVIVQAEINDYNGSSTVRLKILDCRESKSSPQNAAALQATHQGSSAGKFPQGSH